MALNREMSPALAPCWWEVREGQDPPKPTEWNPGSTHTLTLCLPMMKDIFLLQGLMKLDQLVSNVMYSPLRVRNRMGE